MSKIRLSAVEVRWCKLQAMRDSVYLHPNQSRNPIEAYDAMVKCRTNNELIAALVIDKCNAYQEAMRFAIEARQAKADA